jgi:lipopolysaccharide/colanic/teichoic acid biosynthesis glycosyltransferase
MSTLSDSGTETVFGEFARTQAAAAVAAAEPAWDDVAPREEATAVLGPADFRPIRTWYVPVKAAVEWTIAASLFVFVAPLIGVLAVLVRLTSPGPAFYSQTRVGRNARLYKIYKLRTMTHNCEAGTGAVWAAKNDPRITPLGRILRDTHLDELPQLINILQGHMGLIGPRPERPELTPALAREIPNYRCRLWVRPGVTGLAQMLLPPDSDLFSVKRKVAHDLHYIRHISLGMDVRIALCTVCHFFAAAFKAACKLLVGGYGKAIAKKCDLPEADQDELFAA